MSIALNAIFAEIHSTIPREILNLTFKKERSVVSVDQLILQDFIKPIALPKINTNCGRLKNIILSPEYETRIDEDSRDYFYDAVFYKIPYSVTEGRHIVEVINLSNDISSTIFNQGYDSYDTSITANMLMRDVIDSYTGSFDENANREVALVGDNIVRINSTVLSVYEYNVYLLCRTGFDETFTNVRNNAIMTLTSYLIAELQNYIYNELSLSVESGTLKGGVVAPKLNEYLDNYRDLGSEENRMIKLLKFRNASTTYDPEEINSILNFMV